MEDPHQEAQKEEEVRTGTETVGCITILAVLGLIGSLVGLIIVICHHLKA